VDEEGRGRIRGGQPLLLYPARIEERVRREDITPHQGTGMFCKEKPKKPAAACIAFYRMNESG
jgi:hypothetical protein